MKDYLKREINVGDTVAFVFAPHRGKRELKVGTVTEVGVKTIQVSSDEENYTLKCSTSVHKDNTRMIVAAVIPARPQVEASEKMDLTGYPIHVGDLVVCMQNPSFNFGESLIHGTVISMSEKYATIDAVEETKSGEDGELFYSSVKPRREGNRLVVIGKAE